MPKDRKPRRATLGRPPREGEPKLSIQMRMSASTVRGVAALAAFRRCSIGEIVEPCLKAGPLFGFRLSVEGPGARGQGRMAPAGEIKPVIEVGDGTGVEGEE